MLFFFRGYTDSSGIIDNITLPAPADTYNVSTETFSEFEVYDLTAVKESFSNLKKIYDWNVRRIKSVAVHQNGSYDSGEVAMPVRVPVVPEYITVHLGAP